MGRMYMHGEGVHAWGGCTYTCMVELCGCCSAATRLPPGRTATTGDMTTWSDTVGIRQPLPPRSLTTEPLPAFLTLPSLLAPGTLIPARPPPARSWPAPWPSATPPPAPSRGGRAAARPPRGPGPAGWGTRGPARGNRGGGRQRCGGYPGSQQSSIRRHPHQAWRVESRLHQRCIVRLRRSSSVPGK